jgi:phosphatidylglycerophosphate synthase
LDGAMARLRDQTTYFGGYLDHVSDKFSNVALLSVLYQTVGHQFLFFIFWDLFMAALLIVEGVSKNIELSHIRSPFEVVVRIVLWIVILISAIQMFF